MTDCCRGWCTIAMNVGPVYAGYTYRSVSSSVVAVVYKFIHSHNVSKCRHASLQPAQMTQIVKSPGILIRTYFITRACSNPNIGSLLLWEIGSCFVAILFRYTCTSSCAMFTVVRMLWEQFSWTSSCAKFYEANIESIELHNKHVTINTCFRKTIASITPLLIV